MSCRGRRITADLAPDLRLELTGIDNVAYAFIVLRETVSSRYIWEREEKSTWSSNTYSSKSGPGN